MDFAYRLFRSTTLLFWSFWGCLLPWSLAYLNHFVRSEWLEYFCHRLAATLFRIALPPVHMQGGGLLEELKQRPCFLVANHTSMLDIPLLMLLSDRVRFLAKAELKKIPLMGAAMSATNHVFVDRKNAESRQRSLSQMKSLLNLYGYWVTVFPEGTRNSSPEPILPFKQGVFKLAQEAGIPVVCVAIKGARDLLPKGSFFLKSWHPLQVQIVARQEVADKDQAETAIRQALLAS